MREIKIQEKKNLIYYQPFFSNMAGDIQVIELSEYILSHEALTHQKNRGDSASANSISFKLDFMEGLLDHYKGTSVVYHKGVLCGQSANKNKLFKKATVYYGFSNLAVFDVPGTSGDLETAVENALGQK
jgi:hypothetical protein